MLAPNYKTPQQLRITAKEHKALISVLGMLERGEFTQVYDDKFGYFATVDGVDAVDVERAFNMSVFSCGTVHCIAGWCDILFGTDFVEGNRDQHLRDLFFGRSCGLPDLSLITTDQAAHALRNYLTTGYARWYEVCHE